ncbi:hypothetical protein B0T14DRAFT_567899 [Immersiella caudata]|uniref:Uncharacterized protein n=1 Tax=Immersiella caudata TaxID=314043 RepID=A0AA39WJ23_9PEZI|nr:hypothetical protein B0T14DRAFT_567899 [Immersiella caudata]
MDDVRDIVRGIIPGILGRAETDSGSEREPKKGSSRRSSRKRTKRGSTREPTTENKESAVASTSDAPPEKAAEEKSVKEDTGEPVVAGASTSSPPGESKSGEPTEENPAEDKLDKGKSPETATAEKTASQPEKAAEDGKPSDGGNARPPAGHAGSPSQAKEPKSPASPEKRRSSKGSLLKAAGEPAKKGTPSPKGTAEDRKKPATSSPSSSSKPASPKDGGSDGKSKTGPPSSDPEPGPSSQEDTGKWKESSTSSPPKDLPQPKSSSPLIQLSSDAPQPKSSSPLIQLSSDAPQTKSSPPKIQFSSSPPKNEANESNKPGKIFVRTPFPPRPESGDALESSDIESPPLPEPSPGPTPQPPQPSGPTTPLAQVYLTYDEEAALPSPEMDYSDMDIDSELPPQRPYIPGGFPIGNVQPRPLEYRRLQPDPDTPAARRHDTLAMRRARGEICGRGGRAPSEGGHAVENPVFETERLIQLGIEDPFVEQPLAGSQPPAATELARTGSENILSESEHNDRVASLRACLRMSEKKRDSLVRDTPITQARKHEQEINKMNAEIAEMKSRIARLLSGADAARARIAERTAPPTARPEEAAGPEEAVAPKTATVLSAEAPPTVAGVPQLPCGFEPLARPVPNPEERRPKLPNISPGKLARGLDKLMGGIWSPANRGSIAEAEADVLAALNPEKPGNAGGRTAGQAAAPAQTLDSGVPPEPATAAPRSDPLPSSRAIPPPLPPRQPPNADIPPSQNATEPESAPLPPPRPRAASFPKTHPLATRNERRKSTVPTAKQREVDKQKRRLNRLLEKEIARTISDPTGSEAAELITGRRERQSNPNARIAKHYARYPPIPDRDASPESNLDVFISSVITDSGRNAIVSSSTGKPDDSPSQGGQPPPSQLSRHDSWSTYPAPPSRPARSGPSQRSSGQQPPSRNTPLPDIRPRPGPAGASRWGERSTQGAGSQAGFHTDDSWGSAQNASAREVQPDVQDQGASQSAESGGLYPDDDYGFEGLTTSSEETEEDEEKKKERGERREALLKARQEAGVGPWAGDRASMRGEGERVEFPQVEYDDNYNRRILAAEDIPEHLTQRTRSSDWEPDGCAPKPRPADKPNSDKEDTKSEASHDHFHQDGLDKPCCGLPLGCRAKFAQLAVIIKDMQRKMQSDANLKSQRSSTEYQAVRQRLEVAERELAALRVAPPLQTRVENLEEYIRQRDDPTLNAPRLSPRRLGRRGVLLAVLAAIVLLVMNWVGSGRPPSMPWGPYSNQSFSSLHGGHFNSVPGYYTSRWPSELFNMAAAGTIGWWMSYYNGWFGSAAQRR